jgi:hypothetical protein
LFDYVCSDLIDAALTEAVPAVAAAVGNVLWAIVHVAYSLVFGHGFWTAMLPLWLAVMAVGAFHAFN